MKVLMNNNNYMYQKNNAQVRRSNSSIPVQTHPVNNLHFTGGKPKLLQKIIQMFTKKSPVIESSASKIDSIVLYHSGQKATGMINQEFFLKEFGKFNDKNGFRIYTKDGELLHNQKPNDYEISDKTVKKLEGNVAMFNTADGVSMDEIFETFVDKATHLFVSDNKNKKIQIFEFPELNQKAFDKAQNAYAYIHKQVNDEIEEYAMTQAFNSGKPTIVEGSAVGPQLEKLHVKEFAKKAGIPMTEIDMSKKK